MFFFFFFSSRRRHTRSLRDWSSDVCSSDLPDTQPPANQQKQAEQDFGEGQGVRDKSNPRGRKQFVGLHLLGKRRQIRGDGKSQDEHRPQLRVGEENLGDARVDKNSAKNEAADPDDRAPEIEWARCEHGKVSFLRRPFLAVRFKRRENGEGGFLADSVLRSHILLCESSCSRNCFIIS